MSSSLTVSLKNHPTSSPKSQKSQTYNHYQQNSTSCGHQSISSRAWWILLFIFGVLCFLCGLAEGQQPLGGRSNGQLPPTAGRNSGPQPLAERNNDHQPLARRNNGQRLQINRCPVRIKVLDHRTCNLMLAPCMAFKGQKCMKRLPYKLLFPNHPRAVLVREPDCGCYVLRTHKFARTVIRRQSLSTDNIHLALTTRLGANPRISSTPIEACKGYINDTECATRGDCNCGGTEGSCTYCNICKKDTGYGLISLDWKNKSIECNQTLDRGLYKHLTLRVCPPTKEEILTMIDPDDRETALIGYENLKKSSGGLTYSSIARLYQRPKANQKLNMQYDWEQMQKYHRSNRRGMLACHNFKLQVHFDD